MPSDRWLPVGYETGVGRVVGAALFEGDGWQVYETETGGRVLAADPVLAGRWVKAGLIGDTVLVSGQVGTRQLRILESPSEFVLAPVQVGAGIISVADAMAFARAFRTTREALEDVPLHDAIYVESHGRLLPTWSVTERISDEVVVGKWLTGGVAVPVRAWRRLRQLVPWIPADDLRAIVEAAGLGTGALTEEQEREAIAETRVGGTGRFRLPGRRALEAFFNEHVIEVLRNEERYRALGIGFPGGIVLHGPPGSGKTFAVDRLVEFLGWPRFDIASDSVGSPYIHETSRKVAEVFERAKEEAPSCVVIDEMEAFLSAREGAGSAGHRVEEVAEFLRRIPEASDHRVLVIGMTNLLDRIDPALLRRGRFDHVIEVGMPDRDEVREVLEDLLSRVATADSLELGGLAEALTGRPLSDVAFVVREAGRIAARAGKDRIDQACLDEALGSLPPPEGKKKIGF